MGTTLVADAQNDACDAVTAGAGANSKLKIYTAAFATLLSTSIIPSWGAASAGVSTAANGIADAVIAASGTAAVCKVTDSSDVERWRGTVGTSGADVIVDTTSFVASGTLTIADGDVTYTHPAS